MWEKADFHAKEKKMYTQKENLDFYIYYLKYY